MNEAPQPMRFTGPSTRIELRRKVRKGTLSCWECKRRKVRCNLATITESTCDGCRRRKTKCVSQEFPLIATKTDCSGQLCDRISHLEAVIGRLAKTVDSTDAQLCGWNAPAIGIELQGENNRSLASLEGPSPTEPIPIPSNSDTASDTGSGNYLPVIATKQKPWPRLASAYTYLDQRATLSNRVQPDDPSLLLIKAWPSQQNLDAILDLPNESLGLFHGTICAPFSTVLNQKPPSLRNMLQLPLPGTHPVLTARKLLTLATYLQNLSPASTRRLEASGLNRRHMMSLAVKTVHNLVTCHDELLESIEGIECVMIESMFQNNAGHLRSAWQSVHRAILVAQMMGLHRSTRSSSLKLLQNETSSRIHPEYMWFRLIQMNRYLSMMLGLLQGTSCNGFANDQVLQGCSPVERMQRMDCVAAGYILQRNEAGLFDMTTNKMIDKMLQSSKASVPPTWWLMPDVLSSAKDGMATLEKIIRVMDQLTHYHLVTQLHLPHIVYAQMIHESNYSETVAADASREILMRFTSLCTSHTFSSFCSGVSYLAFIACVVLCIVHVDANHQRRDVANDGASHLDLLMHQHPRDRGLMEISLDSMRRTAHTKKDVIASKMANALGHLLSVETDTAVWRRCVASPAEEKVAHGHGCDSKLSAYGRKLEIHVPSIGTIIFEQDSRMPTGAESLIPIDRTSFMSILGAPQAIPQMAEDHAFAMKLSDYQGQGTLDCSNLIPGDQVAHPLLDPNLQVFPSACDTSYVHQCIPAANSNKDLNNSYLQSVESLSSIHAVTSNDWDLLELDKTHYEGVL